MPEDAPRCPLPEHPQLREIAPAATGGAILASKDVIERLEADDATATGLDPDAIAYTPLAEVAGATDKTIRDAGTIPLTQI